MRTPLALLNLANEKMRTFVAVVGVAFAIILVFMQFGFFGAVETTATHLYEQLDFDLVVVSSEYIDITRPDSFPLTRLQQVRGFDEVARAAPLYVGYQLWRNPEPPRQRRSILVLAFKVPDTVFRIPAINARARALLIPDRVLIDSESRPDFGPKAPGTQTEIGNRHVTIAGEFTLGAGFAADGTLICSDRTFQNVFATNTADHVNLGLISLNKGADPLEAARRLNAVLPKDVMVLTRSAIEDRARNYWVTSTSIGVIFGLGVIVALVVGMVFVYQVISSDITNHLSEYATLKAIGYSQQYLSGVVIQEALVLSILGYVPALAVSLILYAITRQLANIPITMTPWRLLFVLALAVGMCALSGILAIDKVKTADPADLF